jgi:hypothetical protein
VLEPYVLKGTSTVLRGGRGSNTPDLPDYSEQKNKTYSAYVVLKDDGGKYMSFALDFGK